MRILIVEDEAIISENIYQQIRAANSYELLEPVDTVETAIEAIKDENPDLIMLDLRLGNGYGGIKIAQYITEHQLKVHFIVISAYSDSEIVSQIKKYMPLSFLIKPFTRESLLVSLELAEEIIRKERSLKCDIKYVTIKTGNKIEKLFLNQIEYIKASEKYIELFTSDGQKKLLRSSLSHFVDEYPNNSFIRVHKSYLINEKYMKHYSDHELHLKSGHKIPVGRTYMNELKSIFKLS